MPTFMNQLYKEIDRTKSAASSTRETNTHTQLVSRQIQIHFTQSLISITANECHLYVKQLWLCLLCTFSSSMRRKSCSSYSNIPRVTVRVAGTPPLACDVCAARTANKARWIFIGFEFDHTHTHRPPYGRRTLFTCCPSRACGHVCCAPGSWHAMFVPFRSCYTKLHAKCENH